jgi:ketosteroid isomerase-like protein
MSTENRGALERALKTVEAASSAMRGDDPEPAIASWAKSPDATVFAPLVPVARGSQAVAEALRRVGFTGGRAEVEYLTVGCSGDLACTVAFERGPARLRGGPERELVLRVTHVYVRQDGEWKVIHRHADLPPTEPS